MTDIQRAPDVLAKWRKNDFNTQWEVDTNTPFSADLIGLFADERKAYAVKFDDDEQPDGAVARLIVGTAGNPDLLDAIDAMLAMWADWSRFGYVYVPDYVERVAAAIVAADEQMNA